MKYIIRLTISFYLLAHSVVYSQTYNFSAVNRLIQDSAALRFGNSVVVLVKKNDSLILWENPSLLFWPTSQIPIASATKWLSGAVVLSIVDDGLVSLDDTIGKYLPIFTSKGKGNITIRQCFSHTSGLPGGSKQSYEFNTGITLAQAVDSIALNVPLQYKPGHGFLYSNLGMHVAGRIMEVVTGKSWDTLFYERIASKCEMYTTSYAYNSPTHPIIAGGISTTANDIMNFLKMVLHNGMYNDTEVLSSAAIDEMFNDQTNKAPNVDPANPIYPYNPLYNPYNMDTIRYGVGTWQDVVNPVTGYTEQISSPGMFSTYPWVDRCRNMAGVIFTFTLVNKLTTNLELEIIDLIRQQTGSCVSVMGVDEKKEIYSPELFPDPAIDNVKIRIENNTGKMYYSVYNCMGSQIADGMFAGSSSNIDVSNYPDGMYFLKLSDGNTEITRKFLVCKN